MEITLEQLQVCLPNAKDANLVKFLLGINETFKHFEINTPQRCAMFLAQTSHESSNFSTTYENLNYSASGLQSIFKKYFPTKDSTISYAYKPERIANRVYANRMGNANVESGEGFRYRGRGLIQLTGLDNYLHCGTALGLDLLSDPDQVANDPVAVLSAGWFWDTRRLNTWADKDDVKTVTKKINGGDIGLPERTAHYNHIKTVLEQL